MAQLDGSDEHLYGDYVRWRNRRPSCWPMIIVIALTIALVALAFWLE